MRSFDFYEFAGVIVPGAVVLVGVTALFPSLAVIIPGVPGSIADAGIWAVLAYAMGHLLEVPGGLLEQLVWRRAGGWPTDWPRSGRHPLLTSQQVSALPARISSVLRLAAPESVGALKEDEWHCYTRQMHAAVSAADRARRVEVFNGNYGLSRGLASGLICLAVLVVLTRGIEPIKSELLLLAGAWVAVWNMRNYGRLYARELFVQFLQLP